MVNNDFSNVNLDNLADVTETDFGDMAQSADMVDVPVATKSVFDAERGNMEQVPIDFDEDDFNFAMRTQRDGIDKANFMGKTEIGDLSSDVDDYFALVNQENKENREKKPIHPFLKFRDAGADFLKNTSFGKGFAEFGISALESLPKGRIRKAETEIEDLRRGYRERKDLSNYKKYFSGDESVLVDGKIETPTIQEAINMTDDEKAERIAELEANINANKSLLDKSQNWFKDYELDANAGEFDKFMYSLGNAGASVGYSFGVAAITKNPELATAVIAGSFGKLQLEETYEKAREKGVAAERAQEMGLSTAAVSGALEAFGFKWLEKAVKANTIFKRIAKGFMTEALQEGSQQAAVEGMESAYGIDPKTWDEIGADALYAAAIGGLTGAATGGVSVVFDEAVAKEQDQAIFNEFVNASMTDMSSEEKAEVLKQEIVKRISNANPELEKETINNLAQDIVERANGSTTKAIMALNQVITKEVNFDTNDFTFDVWLAQVKKNLMKRGYTAEQIEEKAKVIRAKEDIKTGFSQVYERAKADIEKGNLGRSEAEVEHAATLLAANAVGMHKGYGQGENVLDYYNKLNVSFEKGMENRLQENPNAYATQPMAQTAYHGSGESELVGGKFSLDYAGTGEGNAAHGYGVYATVNYEVADEKYREMVVNARYEKESNRFNEDILQQEYDKQERKASSSKSQVEWDKLALLEDLLVTHDDAVVYANYPKELQEWYTKSIRNIVINRNRKRGQVYELDIPENIDLLDEQKSIYKQRAKIKKAVVSAMKEVGLDKFTSVSSLSGLNGADVYDMITRKLDFNQKKTSELLYKYGIKGITYDGREDGRSFVIFNPEDIKIVQRFYQFAGTQSQTAALDELERAKGLLAQGVNAEDIRKQTGWFKGVDGKWRYEISDADATINEEEIERISEGENLREQKKSLLSEIDAYRKEMINNPDDYPEGYLSKLIDDLYDKIDEIDYKIDNGYITKGARLEEILNHEKLYAAYPYMRNIMVYVKKLPEATGGQFVVNRGIIEIDYSRTSPEELKSILMHEIQHIIQTKEGFSSGGNLSIAKAYKAQKEKLARENFSKVLERKIKEKLQNIIVKGLSKEQIEDLFGKYNDNLNTFFNNEATDEEIANAEKRYKNALEEYNVSEDEFEQAIKYAKASDVYGEALAETESNLQDVSNYDVYKRFYGEVEARNTQTRINMTDAERMELSPERTQDVKNAEAIVVFSDGTAASYDAQQQTGAGRRGEIERTPQGYVIRLFEQADPSTLLHEMWHLFTFQLQEAAKTSERAKADWEVLANWSGYNQAVTPDEKRAALERMARGGEQYLMKGKAPSNRLKFAFENFKQWLTDVYESIKNLNVEINYDVEKVFARLVGGKSLDYAFVSEKTELGQELKRMRQKNIDAVVSGRYIISDQTQMREITGIERMKALTQAIIDLTKINKGKDLLLVMSDNFGDQTIEDIGNLIKTTKMRLPRKGDTLYTKMIKEGGITKELDRQFDITGLMGLERNDKLVRKPTKKEKVIGANGQENIVWSKDKPKPIETEEQLLDFLKALKLLPELQADYTYADLDAEWLQAMNILENAPTTYLDNGARKIAEEAVAEANRILEDIFQKPMAEIEEDYENFLEINRDFDIVSKDMLKDIRGLAVLIERETNRLQRLVKKEALEDARAVRDDIIGLLERSIPAAQRSAFMKYISEIDTYERLISRLPTLVNRIVFLQEKLFNEKLYRRIENVLKWSKSYKDSSGKRVSKFRDGDVQDFMDEANKLFLVKNKEKAAEMIEKLLPSEENVISRDNVFKIKMLQVAAKLDGTVAENYLDVYNVLLDTYKAGKFAGEAERELRKEREQKLAETAYNIIEKVKPEEKGLKKDIKQKIKGFFYTQQGWEDLMDILSGGDKASKEYESELSKAARVLSEEVAERGKANQWGLDLMKFLSEALGGKDDRAVLAYVNNLGKKIDLGTWATESETKWGKKKNIKIEMSKDEMIDFYMKWKDEGSKKAILSKNGNGFSENMANAILNNLTQEDINVAEALFNFYKSTRDEVFEAYRDEFGVSLGKVEWYSPRYRDVNGEIESYYRSNIKAVSTGRVKERTDSTNIAIQFLGAFKTVDRYIAEVSHYTVWRKKMRDLNVIFGDKDVKEAIRERFGNDIIRIIDDQIKDFATNGKKNAKTVDNIINGFRTNFTISALAIKPALTLKQMTSIFAFMEYVPAKDFIKDLSYAMTHFKEIKAILDESPLMKTRFANMQLEVNEMVNKKAIQRFVSSPKLQEAMMVFVQLGDIGAIYTGGWSVYAQAIREGKSKQEALQIFERAANSSQQSSYLSELSDWQRGNSFAKLFTMFASSQNQYFRKEMAAVRNIINGRVDKTKAAKRILIYHFLLPMLFQWVCDLGRWDGKAQLRVALIGSLNGIFLIKDMFDALLRKAQGERVFDQTLSIYNTLNDISETLGKSIKTWLNNPDFEDVCESIKDLGVVSGEAAGLPFGQLENLWEGATNLYEGNIVEGLEILAGWTPYAVKNAEGGIPKDIAKAFE